MNREKEIYNYLKENHTGKENAVFSKDLEQRFSLSDRSLRRMISDLREKGFPVCSGCTGYYLGQNRKEINKTARWLGKLANGIAAASDNVMDISVEAAKPVGIFIWIGGPMDMDRLEDPLPEKQALAERLIRFFQENDSHEKERAKEPDAKKKAMEESLRMLDSDLLMTALLEVLDRVQKEEPNFMKRNNLRLLYEDLEAFYSRQKQIRKHWEGKD